MTTARRTRTPKNVDDLKKQVEELQAQLLQSQIRKADADAVEVVDPAPGPLPYLPPGPVYVDRDGDGRPDGTGTWLARVSGYIGWAVVLLLVMWIVYSQGKSNPETPVTPDAPVVSNLLTEIAPLFPPGSEAAAVDYATFYAAVAEKAALDNAPLKKSTRDALLGTIPNRVPGLAPIVERQLGDLKEMPADQPWPADKVARYIDVFREVSNACLSASSD